MQTALHVRHSATTACDGLTSSVVDLVLLHNVSYGCEDQGRLAATSGKGEQDSPTFEETDLAQDRNSKQFTPVLPISEKFPRCFKDCMELSYEMKPGLPKSRWEAA